VGRLPCRVCAGFPGCGRRGDLRCRRRAAVPGRAAAGRRRGLVRRGSGPGGAPVGAGVGVRSGRSGAGRTGPGRIRLCAAWCGGGVRKPVARVFWRRFPAVRAEGVGVGGR